MILGQSVKSVLRTPLKTILFILLIAAVTAFACLGFGMLTSGNRLIKAADETYTTKAVIEYIDEGYPDVGNYSAAMIKDLSDFDRTVFADNENVLSYETKYDVGGYIEGFRSKIMRNTYGKFSVIRFRYRHTMDDPEYGQISIQEIYYKGDNDFNENSLLYISNEAARGLKEDHVYIANGVIKKEYKSTITFILTPYTNEAAPDDRLFDNPIWDITDLLENNEYEQNEKFTTFMNIVESYNVMNNFVNIEMTKDVKFATPFLLQQTNLMDDGVSRFFTQEEYDSSAKVVILSNFILARCGKSVGDTVRIGLYPVNSDGTFAKYSFWPDTSYADCDEYTIVGVFKETSNSLNKIAFIPMPEGAEEWLPDNAISYTIGNVVLKNGTAEQYIQDIQPHLLEAMRVSIYDQGYSQTVAPLLAIRETAVLLSAVSAICCLVVLILFAYIFVAKQKDTAATMVSMGAGKRRALAYLLICVLIIVVIASALGAFIGYRLSERVTTEAYERAEKSLVIDNSFSAVYMSGDEVKFVPDFKPGVLPIAAVACAVLVLALLISLLVSSSAVKRSAPKLGRSYGEGLRRAAFAINLAVKSIFRGGAKNIVVPLVSLVLIVFIGIFAREISTSSDKLDEVYNNSEVYAYCTTFRGKRLDRLTFYEDQLDDLKKDTHIEELYLSCNQYLKMLSYRKAGTEAWQSLQEPDAYYYDPDAVLDFSPDTAINPYVDYDKIYFTESIAHCPEFLFRTAPLVEYLDGYSEDSFKGNEYICALPSSYMESLGLELGDEVQCFAKRPDGDAFSTREMTLKIVASFEKASSKNNMYVPLAIKVNEYYLCTYKIAWDDGMGFGHIEGQTKLPLDTPQEVLDTYDSYEYVNEGDIPYNSAVFKLRDLRTLNDFKASLKEWGFSSVDGIGKQRIWVVVEDTFLNKSVENINRHITYMTILFTVVYVLAVAIGFVLSYLLTKNRRSELAMMRSMGTGIIRTFFIFFLEQFLLCLIGGALGILIVWLVYGEIVKLQWLGFAGYFICYWVGVAISTIIMNRVDVIKLLSAKD